MFTAVIYNSQDLERGQVPISGWVGKQDVVHLHNVALEKKELLPFVRTWMDLEAVILSEISQSEKEKYHMISLICGI